MHLSSVSGVDPLFFNQSTRDAAFLATYPTNCRSDLLSSHLPKADIKPTFSSPFTAHAVPHMIARVTSPRCTLLARV